MWLYEVYHVWLGLKYTSSNIAISTFYWNFIYVFIFVKGFRVDLRFAHRWIGSIICVKTYSPPGWHYGRNCGHVKQTRSPSADVMIKALSVSTFVARRCHYIYPTTWRVGPGCPSGHGATTHTLQINKRRAPMRPAPQAGGVISGAIIQNARTTDQPCLHDHLVIIIPVRQRL